MSVHEKALKGIFDDMDDFESKKMFGGSEAGNKGFSVTITMNPDESHDDEKKEEGADGDDGFEDLPADHDEKMCGGGCALHKGEELKLSGGGMIPGAPDMGETDDLKLPPFLRKKKIPTNR